MNSLMTRADSPTASSRSYVVDMSYAALSTLPRGGDAGDPEPQLTGTNTLAADTGLQGVRELFFVLVYPFFLLRRILRTIGPTFDWPAELAARIRRGDILAHDLQLAFHAPFDREDDARRFLSWLQVGYCLPYPDERGHARIPGGFLGLRAGAWLGEDGRPSGVLLRAG
jgi:hypothetical protein